MVIRSIKSSVPSGAPCDGPLWSVHLDSSSSLRHVDVARPGRSHHACCPDVVSGLTITIFKALCITFPYEFFHENKRRPKSLSTNPWYTIVRWKDICKKDWIRLVNIN